MCVVARLNVYVPDDLAARARAAGLNVSALAQEAIARSLGALSTDTWLSGLASPSRQVGHDQVMQALDDVREAPVTRHG
jgi:post-segregation antitoxin (ccd killing protein)